MVQTRKKSFKKNKGKGNVQKGKFRKTRTRTGTRKRKYRGGVAFTSNFTSNLLNNLSILKSKLSPEEFNKYARTKVGNAFLRFAENIIPGSEEDEQLRSHSGREIRFQNEIFEKLKEIKDIMKEEGERSLSNQTLLHIVANKGEDPDAFNIMEMLLQDVNAQPESKFGSMTWTISTPLYDAVESGNIDMVKLLIEKGANKNKKGPNDFYSPIEYVTAKLKKENTSEQKAVLSELLNALNQKPQQISQRLRR